MISCVSNIMIKKINTVDAYDGICKAERIMDENNINCIPVMHDGKLVGVLTSRDIRKTHPNRIVADAMTKKVISVTPETSLWKAKQVFEENKIETLLVKEKDSLVGLVTKTCLYTELGKYYDPLTGLYRSEYIYHMGMELLEKGFEISVIFIDLNEFGQIDKEFGHAQGDLILKELGMLLKSHSHGDTYLCRFGGDEFVVLTQYNLDKCMVLAEILLKAISTHKFKNNINVTASAGIAGGRRQDARAQNPRETVMDLINLASLASTKAKKEKTKLAVADGFFQNEIACGSA
ncbi:diguanylate cyclase (GGDEF) domain-containing protein [Desulforamulus putei DSM 12395]|uniref:Diguanylate cyclase (GGDEF) domain-containing protein n=2 Tax=Desulforamulus putei TaxID=74701 RepID=A0A1M4Y8J9_9FIRM|nr:diguanylate cyclase (GGDEF) domain-containing protein [Desulforamulus putei DSM 12395]